MDRSDIDRRTVLRGMGVLATGVLAGCSGGSGGGTATGGSDGNPETTAGGGTEPTDSTAPSTEPGGSTATTESTTGGADGAQVEQYLSAARGYDGSIADMTGNNTVEIAVGAGESGFAFDPAAVRVSPGTTIRWAWTGRGGAHNVVAEDGAFNSGQPQVGETITYEATLDQPGTHLYYCEPHRRLGMKGAVVVSA